MNKSSTIQFPIPIFINREGKWFVAECPLLNVATQGRTEKEVRENMKDILQEYLRDIGTPKEFLKKLNSPSLTYVSVPVPSRLLQWAN
jgi:predicted RNase H-like HicB family nuclease